MYTRVMFFDLKSNERNTNQDFKLEASSFPAALDTIVYHTGISTVFTKGETTGFICSNIWVIWTRRAGEVNIFQYDIKCFVYSEWLEQFGY